MWASVLSVSGTKLEKAYLTIKHLLIVALALSGDLRNNSEISLIRLTIRGHSKKMSTDMEANQMTKITAIYEAAKALQKAVDAIDNSEILEPRYDAHRQVMGNAANSAEALTEHLEATGEIAYSD